MEAVPGDVPPAGKTPDDENRPQTYADPDVAFFRALGAPDPEAAGARHAGHRDTSDELAEPATTGRSEPGHHRPTVVLDRGQLSSPPQRQAPPSPLLESSTFWLTDEQRAERSAAAPVTEPPRPRPRDPRRPATGLAGVVALGLIAAFFGWVSAEPFWLTFGHGVRGVATVGQCTGDGVGQHCAGEFRAADGSYAVTKVTLLGVEAGRRHPGTASPARMVDMTSRQAYVEPAGLLLPLRWMLGFALVLACGLGIAALTGARRLETARASRAAIIMSLTGPAVLLLGFLYAAY